MFSCVSKVDVLKPNKQNKIFIFKHILHIFLGADQWVMSWYLTNFNKKTSNKIFSVVKIITYLSVADLVWFYDISTIVGYLMPNPSKTYILNIYDLVGFYGISTIVGYLMPNPFYTCILNIWFQIHFIDLSDPELIFFHIVKWFHLLLSNMNNSIHC